MKIGIDATPLSIETGGIRRYTLELSNALRETSPADECLLLKGPGRGGSPPLAERRSVLGGTNRSSGWFLERLERRWWLCGLPLRLWRERFDVFHGTDFAVPYVPVCASVMTLHDLSPWKREPWQTASARVRRRTPFLLGLGLATLVVTPTEAVRREAIEHFRLVSSRVIAVPEAASARFRPVAGVRGPRPYFLFVGTLDPRKNLDVAVEAWRPLREQADFAVAGRGRLAEEPGLRHLGAVPEAELPALYSGAEALVLPSLYEGFGLPILEAMQCGTPVIASRDAALMEVSGGAALHVDACDVRGWTEAMRSVLDGAPALREAGLRRAAEFSWLGTAERMRDVYQEAIGRFRGAA